MSVPKGPQVKDLVPRIALRVSGIFRIQGLLGSPQGVGAVPSKRIVGLHPFLPLCFLVHGVSGFLCHDVLPCQRPKAVWPISYELEPLKL
jgi:hypothetical protein